MILRITDRYGKRCGLDDINILDDSDSNYSCKNNLSCIGCEIENNDNLIEFSNPFITVTCVVDSISSTISNDQIDNNSTTSY